MLFIFDGSGNSLKVVPEKVYQGSNKANTVYFAMPLSALTPYEVNVQYRLPTGEVLPTARMVAQGKVDGVTYGDQPVYVWTIDLTSTVTSFVGQVTMQFFVTFGEEIIATAAGEFIVSKGVPVKLPTPTADQQITYNQIIATLSSIENVLIDTASSSGFTFTGYTSSGVNEAFVTGYTGATSASARLKVAPFTLINGTYYKVVAYGSQTGSAAVVNHVDIQFPETLEYIFRRAFYNVDMSDAILVIPKKIRTLDSNALDFKATSAITRQRIVFESAAFPTDIADDVFGTNDGTIELYVPLSAYDSWKAYATKYDSVKTGRVVVKSVVDVDYLIKTLTAYQTKQDSGLNTTAQTIVGAINENAASIAKNASDLYTEATARQNADNALQQNIDNEAAARANADTALEATIDGLRAKVYADLAAYYYTKSETYSQAQVNKLLASVNKPAFEVVDELPESGEQNIIYLVKKETSSEQNDVYDEYIWITDEDGTSHWEHIGSTAVDLSDYYTKEEITALLNNQKTEIITTCNAYTDAAKTACNQYTDTAIATALGDIESVLAEIDTGAGVGDTDYFGETEPAQMVTTATAADVLNGKTAFSNGTKVEGAIEDYDGTNEQ